MALLRSLRARLSRRFRRRVLTYADLKAGTSPGYALGERRISDSAAAVQSQAHGVTFSGGGPMG